MSKTPLNYNLLVATTTKHLIQASLSLLLSAVIVVFLLIALKSASAMPVSNGQTASAQTANSVVASAANHTGLYRATSAYTAYLPIVARAIPSGECITTPNDSFPNAFGPLLPDVYYCGYLEDQYDFYYIEVSTPTQILVTLENQDISPNYPPNNTLALYTPDHQLIDWCCMKRKHTLSLSASLTATGRYYFLVYAIDFAPSLTYTLSWSPVP